MNMPNISNMFQKNILFAGGKQAAKNRTAPCDTLQQLSSQIIGKQQGSDKENAKLHKLKVDTYDKTESSQDLDEMSDGALKYYLHVSKIFSTSSQRQEQDLLDFKDKLQEMDKSIKNYQDILNGHTELPENLKMEDVAQALTKATENREQFIKDGVSHLNKWSKYFITDDNFNNHMQKVLGDNKFAGRSPSDWMIDTSDSDIYSKIDKALAETHSITEELDRAVQKIYNMLEKDNPTDKYKHFLESWVSEDSLYFKQIDNNNIQAMILDNLKK